MADATPDDRSPQRREKLLANGSINGIDWIEVLDSTVPAGVPRQRLLLVHCFLPVPPTFTSANVRIDGGVRITVGVLWAFPATVLVAGQVDTSVVAPAQQTAINKMLGSLPAGEQPGSILVVRTGPGDTDGEGDLSTYTLTLAPSGTTQAFDPKFASIDFSFKVECPKRFDCAPDTACPPQTTDEPRIDYLARDYAGFRRLMLDRLDVLMPGWSERNPADVGVMLVELLAYAADQLSYYQDAVGTEAYLGTARSRISVRRHARLLDYMVQDGCNARVWVVIGAGPPDGTRIPAGTRLCAGPGGGKAVVPPAFVSDPSVPVFETMHDLTLFSAHDDIAIHTWGSDQWWLPSGTTQATLRSRDASKSLALAPGDVLVFEQVRSPVTGLSLDADPALRHPVRLVSVSAPELDQLYGVSVVEVAWHNDDALPFSLCVSVVRSDGTVVSDLIVARGNVVLADHGGRASEQLPPLPASGLYRPTLQATGTTCAAPYDDAAVRVDPASHSASSALAQDPRQAVPLISLTGDDGSRWKAVYDLLGSTEDDRNFVVEVERDGREQLRFGDGVQGLEPEGGLEAAYRVGNGADGNVAAEAITAVVDDGTANLTGVEYVRNPLPAQGGVDPESIDEVRLYAPQAFRTLARAVTPGDYATIAQRHPDVSTATATLRWTGSWATVFITVDRLGGRPVDDAFKTDVRAFLEAYRLAGHDLKIEAPTYVPLEIVMHVCVAAGYSRSDVRAALLDTFSNADLSDGSHGFFYPDNFTFGQAVYLSRVIAAAMGVPGVTYATIQASDPSLKFQRFGRPAQGEIDAGLIAMNRLEIARLDNSANFPENGLIDFVLEGGT